MPLNFDIIYPLVHKEKNNVFVCVCVFINVQWPKMYLNTCVIAVLLYGESMASFKKIC